MVLQPLLSLCCVEVAVGQKKNYWRGAHTILASTDMQHMVFGLSWPLLATNCYRRRTGIEYILQDILQPCRQTIASVQFKTWCIIIFMATPPPSGKYPARQKLPNQLPTFALRHALVSLEEPTNGDVCCNLNAVLSKKRCFRNRVFTHYGLKAYKYKVINMFVNKVQI